MAVAEKSSSHIKRNVERDARTQKEAFDPDLALARIEKALAGHPKAALFELYERGFTSVFEQLCACIISIRTLDEVTIPVSLKLFSKVRTPEDVLALSVDELATLLKPSTFHDAKARQLFEMAQTLLEKFDGQTPCDFGALTSLRGVGPKCANLTLGIACQRPSIAVDIHVHRVTNRWGVVKTATPEKTLKALESLFAKDVWIDVNRLLMPFGKFICTGTRPKCSQCPVLEMCQQVGVTTHR